MVIDKKIRSYEVLRWTSKNTRPFVHRAGFHAAVSHYVGKSDTINRFSGTCLNRQIRKNEKERIQGEAQTLKEVKKRIAGRVGFVSGEPGSIPAWSYPGVPRKTENNKLRIKGEDTASHGERKIPVYVFSQRTRRIIKDKSTAFYRSAGYKKTFCTLTFINDPETDAVAVSVLNKFLTILRREHDNFQYLWVAERQTENNDRIHFHLIFNCRISIKRFNGLWVLQQYNAGITHEKCTHAEIQARFEAGTMQEVFNPVDVRKIVSIGHLAAYLTKYISKGNNTGGFGCRVWHCSRGVSALITKQIVTQECIEVAKSMENCVVNKKTGEILREPAPVKNTDGRGIFYTVWRINQPGRFLCFLREMEQINKWIIQRTFSRDQIIEYLATTITPDKYRTHFLN
jgi:hypothetical protein